MTPNCHHSNLPFFTSNFYIVGRSRRVWLVPRMHPILSSTREQTNCSLDYLRNAKFNTVMVLSLLKCGWLLKTQSKLIKLQKSVLLCKGIKFPKYKHFLLNKNFINYCHSDRICWTKHRMTIIIKNTKFS